MDRLSRIGFGRRPSYAVDHVLDAAVYLFTKTDREQIIQARSREAVGDLKRVRGVDGVIRFINCRLENAVAAHTIAFEVRIRRRMK